MELNQLYFKLKHLGFLYDSKLDFSIDKRYLTSMEVDIRVTISWDVDEHDIELYCVEPNNEICYSFSVC